MNPRDSIRQAAMDDSYMITAHAIDEADKDSISMSMIEDAMINGVVSKTDRKRAGRTRYSLRFRALVLCVELGNGQVVVVTVGRERQ